MKRGGANTLLLLLFIISCVSSSSLTDMFMESSVKAPPFRMVHVMEANVTIGPKMEWNSKYGERRVVSILGGVFKGPLGFNGTILPGTSDHQRCFVFLFFCFRFVDWVFRIYTIELQSTPIII